MKFMEFKTMEKYGIADMLAIMRILRSEDGCPWDREQTHQSIKKNLIEETDEVIAAIDNSDLENLKEELGDLLLQVVFHSQISEENGGFDFSDVVNCVCQKLVSRHTHVFGGENAQTAQTAEEAVENWNNAKKAELKSIDN